uniref:arrestin domain-containing protein 3-like n=1 Tax=Semicossyphus pulcher TaxID=241346 RepID=UPI0037E8BCCD
MFQQTIQNFNIHFNSLNERNTVSSGDLVTGHISFELTKQTKITSITMAMKGKAHVHWSSGGGKNRRSYSARLEFFNFKSIILHENSVSGMPTELQPGRHMFPITCQLPQGDFPSSFQGVHGQIAYTLTVGIHRPWHLSKDFSAQLNFVNRINYNQPELWAPLSGSNNKTLCCLWCASGPISMTVNTEKKAFTPGETVKLICNFSNASSRIITPKVKLQQRQVFYTLSKASRRMCVKDLVSITGHPISAHTSDVHNEIMLTIPSIAPNSITNCSILEVEYVIQVTLCISFASNNLTVLIPIILCDTYISAQPPAYS